MCGNMEIATLVLRMSSDLAIIVLILDVAKAATPVGLSYYNLGIRGIPMYLIAIAPVLGHAFSPFLGFRGGKAIATSLGVWIGLTIWKASLVGVVGTIIGITLMTSSAWAVMLGLVGILITLLIWMPEPLLLLVWVSETFILVWTHRVDLKQKPRLRPWLAKRRFPAKM
jgi:glycerol-3-phosphate acyltransferase PlsY